MSHLDSFSAIPVFVAVVESGSFSAAGQRLGITKSAVSKRISQLEETLGARLLQRTTRSLSLTEAGEQYFEHVRGALTLAQEGEDAISQLQGQPQGVLKVSTPMVFGRLHIAPLVATFLKRFLGIQLQMVMDDKMVDLVEGGFDLAIRIGHIPESRLVARRLAPVRSVLCASPDYLQQHGVPLTPEDLRQHNCLFYSLFRGGAEWTFNGADGPVRVQPRGNFQVNNSEALREALVAGLGICQMPTFIVGPDLASGRLVALLPDYPLPQHAAYAMFPERRHLPAKTRVFMDFLAEQLGGDEPVWERAPALSANPPA
ncbi:LysR family transcriptional regulator [Pokkaliibacter plantistimulans]|uniref:LysR family transcriptional regulator n=1 Tax=Pokkaliibacter plantistimulans TaxID=1635171 RepID=UPI0026B742DF|nr:LysR family transcriptional regulator [Pokkaliibacter plantistimulans]